MQSITQILIQSIVAIVGTLIASSAFWQYMIKRLEHHGDMVKLLTGLAQDAIIHTGLDHLQRGYITHDDYKNLVTSLYLPYVSLGGNGTAKRIIELVKALPMRDRYESSDTMHSNNDE